jgi:uncharacterized protein
VSGLYNPYGTPGRIIDLVMAGRVQILYDDRILGEYLDVLARPQLDIDSSLAQAVVQYFRLSGERVIGLPLADATFPDTDDAPFAEIAVSASADALVTGNMKHFSMLKDRGVPVFSPAQFLEKFI